MVIITSNTYFKFLTYQRDSVTMSSQENAYKTATTRIEPSAPMRQLATDGLIVGRALDYGCGKGFDADYYDMESYDPHFGPGMEEGYAPEFFDTITCNYVLNVLESARDRVNVLQRIQALLSRHRGGKAYITVRNDRRALNGVTKTGSWQGLIVLRLPVRYKCAGYVTYELTPLDHIDLSIQSAV